MLHVEYVRDIHSNYVVIKGITDGPCGYRTKIILNNNIEGLLKVELKFIDQMDLLYYDITGKKSLAAAYENKSLQYEDIKKLLTSILKTINGSGEYLLSENDFIMEPEYIFVGDNLEMVDMCYLEGYQTNMLIQFSKLMEYLMNKVDYKDENAVVLTYGLYKESREEDCTYERLMKELEKKLPLQENKIDSRNKDKTQSGNMDHNSILPDKDIEKYPNSNTRNHEESKQYKELKSDKDIKTNRHTRPNKDIGIEKATKKGHSDLRQDKLDCNKKQEKDNKKGLIQNIRRNYSIVTSLFENKYRQSGKNKLKNNRTNKDKKIDKTVENNKYVQNGTHKNIGNDYPFIEEIQSDKEILVYEKKTYLMAIGAMMLGFILLMLIIKLKLLHNIFGTQIDSIKLIGCVLIICSVEIYIFSKLFNPTNRITKMVPKVEYIEPNLEEVLEMKNHRDLHIDKNSNIGIQAQSDTLTYREKEVQLDIIGQVHSDMILESELSIDHGYNEGSRDNLDGGIEDTVVLWKEDEESDSEKTKILADLTSKKQYYLESSDNANTTIIPIKEFPFIIGKLATGVNHRIQDQAVSRRHIKFIKEKEDIYLIDLGSTNGTFLNNIRLTNHKLYKLSDNDEILIAQNKFYWKIK